jgi:hypothetical protein
MNGGTPAPPVNGRRNGWIEWPVRILGPQPGLKEINIACWGLLAAFLVLGLGVPLWTQFRTGVGTIHILPADFIYFYGIGIIAGSHPLPQLYDYNLQLATFNRIFPLHDGAYGPSPYPPFVALFFSLLARLPFMAAYFAWLGVSLALYLAGVGAAVKGAFPGEPLKVSLAFWFALSLYPFVVGTLANGQLASVAVFAVGLAVAFEENDRRFTSGLVLSILAYKPTLLLLLVPMLLITRRFRAFAGFAAGVAALVLGATAFGGVDVWPAYVRFLNLFGRIAVLGGHSGLPLEKFVDLHSFVEALPGGRSRGAGDLFYAVAGVLCGNLAVCLWKSARKSGPAQRLAWAATLTWTLLLNVYVPIYDSVLVVIAVILTVAALKELGWIAANRGVVLLAVVIVAGSWVTSGVAEAHGIQILSILLSILGFAQLYLLHRTTVQSLPEVADAPQAG